MSRIIKLRESSFKRLFEYVGDEEEMGRYDIDKELYDMPDDEYQTLLQKSYDAYEDEEEDMKEYMADDYDDQFMGPEYYGGLSDYDLYKGMI